MRVVISSVVVGLLVINGLSHVQAMQALPASIKRSYPKTFLSHATPKRKFWDMALEAALLGFTGMELYLQRHQGKRLQAMQNQISHLQASLDAVQKNTTKAPAPLPQQHPCCCQKDYQSKATSFLVTYDNDRASNNLRLQPGGYLKLDRELVHFLQERIEQAAWHSHKLSLPTTAHHAHANKDVEALHHSMSATFDTMVRDLLITGISNHIKIAPDREEFVQTVATYYDQAALAQAHAQESKKLAQTILDIFDAWVESRWERM